MAELSVYEQLMLELVNRARLNPAAEAARDGISLNSGLRSGTLSSAARQALAPNDLLNAAAASHSAWMLARDVFSHTGSGGSDPGDRMDAAGYNFTGSWSWGENIAWVGTTGTLDLEASAIRLHVNLFRSALHRVNILNDGFQEVGLGIEQGGFRSGGVTYNAAMATQDFARSGTGIFITGVAITEGDGDHFYDIGEGRSGILATVSNTGGVLGSDSTGTAGGYAVRVAAGTVDLTFSGGDLAASVSVTVEAGSKNAKVDLEGASTILSSATTTLGAGATGLVLLGCGAINGTGNGESNLLVGNAGKNVLSGGAGDDVLVGGGGHDYLYGGDGLDTFDYNSVSQSKATSTLRDTIFDFASGEDVIDLSTIDANTRTSGNQDFTWRGAAAFSGRAGQLRIQVVDQSGTDNDYTVVAMDVNGDKKADMHIVVKYVTSLSDFDFIF